MKEKKEQIKYKTECSTNNKLLLATSIINFATLIIVITTKLLLK